MSNNKPTERLVLFSRYPEPGKVKTRLIPALGPEGTAHLQEQMTEHALQRVRALAETRSMEIEVRYEGGTKELMEAWLGVDLSLRVQGNGNLGNRMERAFSDGFRQGIDRVVIIGADCPGITPVILRSAFNLLGEFDMVLGPANDGGYYLIGLQRPISELFSNIPWGASEVGSKTLKIANQLGLRVATVEPLDDVDRPEDIEVYKREAARAANSPVPDISIIVPTLNEAEHLEATLTTACRTGGVEIIVVDGGSWDGTVEVAKKFGIRLITTPPGRAGQVNAGAMAASGNILMFLHGDTRLPKGFDSYVVELLERRGTVAGSFKLGIEGSQLGLRIIEKLANFRSRFMQLPYGDQAIFLRAEAFRSLGGFPEMPIMEDYVFVQRLKKRGRVEVAPVPVITSARRWLQLGILKTTLINQVVLLAYVLGTDPARLARWYQRQKGLQEKPKGGGCKTTSI